MLTPEQLARLTLGQRADYLAKQQRIQAAREQAAAARRDLDARQEAAQRAALRSAWKGSDAAFEKAYPALLEAYRTKIALDSASMPQGMRPKVSF